MEPAFTIEINYALKNDESFNTSISIYKYTDKSIAMMCSEHFGKSFKENLSEIGSFNPRLKIGKGWIFSNTKYPALNELIQFISEKKIKGSVPIDYTNKNISASTFFSPLSETNVDPPLVSTIKILYTKIKETKTDTKTVHTSGDYTYVWGKRDEVIPYIASLNKSIISEFNSDDVVVVMIK
jgi:hypothetical protein